MSPCLWFPRCRKQGLSNKRGQIFCCKKWKIYVRLWSRILNKEECCPNVRVASVRPSEPSFSCIWRMYCRRSVMKIMCYIKYIWYSYIAIYDIWYMIIFLIELLKFYSCTTWLDTLLMTKLKSYSTEFRRINMKILSHHNLHFVSKFVVNDRLIYALPAMCYRYFSYLSGSGAFYPQSTAFLSWPLNLLGCLLCMFRIT